jgi:hypothetical protein
MNHTNYRRDRDPRPPAKPTGARVFWIVGAMVLAAIAVSQLADKPSAQAPPPKKPMAKLNPSDMQERATMYGILEAAKVGKDELAARQKGQLPHLANWTDGGEPANEMRVEKTDRGYKVVGAWSENPYVLPQDEDEAKADAVRVATQKLTEELNGLTPAVEVVTVRTEKPTAEMQKKWKDGGVEANRGWVVVDVQTSEEAVRHERMKGRFGKVGFWAGVAFLNLFALYAFLRLDMWTRGYLTTFLGVGIVALVVGTVLFLVRSGYGW